MALSILNYQFYFNPHHREGGDEVTMKIRIPRYISIHTTAKVVTVPHCLLSRRSYISIHTTAKVVTRQDILHLQRGRYFNPHHREGGDTLNWEETFNMLTFQSTPPRRW